MSHLLLLRVKNLEDLKPSQVIIGTGATPGARDAPKIDLHWYFHFPPLFNLSQKRFSAVLLISWSFYYNISSSRH